MKSNQKLKGFTLIELIVVMAIFSIVMFGALQLVRPVSKIFTSTYKQESVSASTDNIKRYIESNIRYAEYVRISDTAPSQDDLVQFVDDYYNGMFYQRDNAGTTEYVSGDLYVMKIDNANGGKISQWKMTYTAGDVKAVGSPVIQGGTTEYYLVYIDDGNPANVLASSDDIASTVTPAFDATKPDIEWAVNKAMYTDYNFNISLGIYELASDGTLVLDSDYYNAFADSDQQVFGARNFALTITAYGVNTAKGTIDRTLDTSTGKYVYNPGFTYSASLSLSNVIAGRTYNTFSWLYGKENPSDLASTTYAEKTTDKSGQPILKYVEKTVSANPMPISVSNMAESDEIYIIYSYMGEDIVKP